jgi:hypothetical protein
MMPEVEIRDDNLNEIEDFLRDAGLFTADGKISTAAMSTNGGKPWTKAEIQQTADAMRAIDCGARTDLIILTEASKAKVIAELAMTVERAVGVFDRIDGIPVEVYGTVEEAKARAKELQDEGGKNVLVLY